MKNQKHPYQFVRQCAIESMSQPGFSSRAASDQGGKIIWINNALGHFAPGMEWLDCVEHHIDQTGLPRASYQFKKNRNWTNWVEPHDEL